MQKNVYAPPSRPSEEVEHARVFAIARYQRALNLCMLFYVACAASFKLAPEGPVRTLAAFASVAVLVVAAVFAALLASRIYSTVVAILVGLLTFIPCGGLVAAFYLSTRATAILRRNGYTVGLLGADLSQFVRR